MLEFLLNIHQFLVKSKTDFLEWLIEYITVQLFCGN